MGLCLSSRNITDGLGLMKRKDSWADNKGNTEERQRQGVFVTIRDIRISPGSRGSSIFIWPGRTRTFPFKYFHKRFVPVVTLGVSLKHIAFVRLTKLSQSG